MWIKMLKAVAGHKVDDLLEVDDSIGKAYVDAGYAEDGGDGPEKALADSAMAELQTQIKGVTEEFGKAFKGLADEMGKLKGTITPVQSEADRTKSFNDMVKCIGAHQKHGDKEAGERLATVYKAQRVDAEGNVIKGFEEASGTSGGYLVAPEYATELLRLPVEDAVIASRVRQVGMGSTIRYYPALRQTDNPATGTTAAVAGVATYRKSEKAQRTSSTAKFDQIKLEATDLIAYTEATRDLLADAPGVESDFQQLFREAISWRRDYDFIHGSGVEEPLGIYNSKCPVTLTASRTTSNEIKYADVVLMLSKLMPICWNRAVWVSNVSTTPQLMTLQDGAGRSIWVNAIDGAQRPMPPTLLGRPILFSEKVPALGNKGDLALIDAGMYLEGLRQGIEIGVSEHFLFDTDQIAYRVKLRNDGKPWLKKPFKQADGSNTQVSPFVLLAA